MIRRGGKLIAVSALLMCLVACKPHAKPGGPYNGTAGTPLTLDGSASTADKGDTLTLTWDFGDGSPAGAGTTPMHTYNTAGAFTVTLTADSQGGTDKATTTATIVAPNLADVSKTTFSKDANNSWASVGGTVLSVATDSGSSTTRWKLYNPAGAANSIGVIESIEFPGKCLRSPDGNNNSQIVLATCDPNDHNQQWNGLAMQVSGGKAFYSFVNNGVQKALTEGPSGQVIQTDFNNLDKQLWAVRKNSTNAFVVDTNPWFNG